MNEILGYISTAFVILFTFAVYLLIASIANDAACASLDMHKPIGTTLMKLIFVCGL